MGFAQETIRPYLEMYKAKDRIFRNFIAGLSKSLIKKEMNDKQIREARLDGQKTVYASNKRSLLAKLPSLIEGPDFSTIESFFTWVDENQGSLTLLDSADMESFYDEKDPETVEFQKIRKDTAEIRGIIKDLIDFYDKYTDLIFAENGDELKLDNAAPGSQEEKAKQARDSIRSRIAAFNKTKEAKTDTVKNVKEEKKEAPVTEVKKEEVPAKEETKKEVPTEEEKTEQIPVIEEEQEKQEEESVNQEKQEEESVNEEKKEEEELVANETLVTEIKKEEIPVIEEEQEKQEEEASEKEKQIERISEHDNRAVLKKYIEGCKAKYKDFKDSAAAASHPSDTKDNKGNTLSDEELRKARFTNLKGFYASHKEDLRKSIPSLERGPSSYDDVEHILIWVDNNLPALAMLDSEEMEEFFNDKNDPDVQAFQSVKKHTAEIRGIVKDIFDVYDKYSDIILKEDGELIELENAAPNSLEAEAQKALEKINAKILDIEYKIDARKFATSTPESDKQWLNNINPESKNFDPVKVLYCVNLITEKHSNNIELLLSCRNAAEMLMSFAAKDVKFAEFCSRNTGYGMMRNILKKGSTAINEKVAKAKKEQLIKKTEPVRTELKALGKELKGASRHDSKEYKEIIAMVNGLTDKNKFLFLGDDGNYTKGTTKLSDAQREALPLYLIHRSINKYLEHKAKDGVNRNAYEKLAAVEKLNKFVSSKIKGIEGLEDFSFSIKENGKDVKLDFRQSDINVTYKDELVDARGDLKNELAAGEIDTGHYNQEEYILADTSHSEDDLKKDSGLTGKNLEALFNASSCMDRIMLRKQTEEKNIREDLSSLMNNEHPEHKGIAKLKAMRESFLNDPIRVQPEAAENKGPVA